MIKNDLEWLEITLSIIKSKKKVYSKTRSISNTWLQQLMSKSVTESMTFHKNRWMVPQKNDFKLQTGVEE